MVMGAAMSWRAEEAAQSSKLGAGGAGLGQGVWFPASTPAALWPLPGQLGGNMCLYIYSLPREPSPPLLQSPRSL